MRVTTFALARAAVESATVDSYVAVLVSGEPASDADRAAVLGLVEGLEEKAWGVQDAMDAGTATVRDYEAAFNRTRAVNALLFALDADASVAAQESVYEAQAATADLPAIRRMVDEVIPV